MANLNQTILVAGETGYQGSVVARHLLQRGNFAVRALVREIDATLNYFLILV